MRPTGVEAARDPWLTKASAAHEHVPPSESEKLALHLPHLQSHLMRMARACLTSQLNLSQLHRMNARFKNYDVSGDGRLNLAEMHQVLEDVGVTATQDVELIIESLDADRSGHIEYSEFIATCIDISSVAVRKQLHTVFAIFDLDGSGAITLEELRQVLTQGARATTPTSKLGAVSAGLESILPDGQSVEALMQELDTNGDGKIQFLEFERHLLAEHARHAQYTAGTAGHTVARGAACFRLSHCQTPSRPARPREVAPPSRRPCIGSCLTVRRRGRGHTPRSGLVL